MATVQDYVGTLPVTQRQIAEQLVRIANTALPDAGALWHGHPEWSPGA
jgi:hypothetical protein